MDKRTRESYRKRLNAELAELQTLLDRTQMAGRNVGDKSRGDQGEEAARSYDKEVLFSQSDSERTHIKLVTKAIERLKGREFGTCEVCGNAIESKRLDAVPWTRYCRDCQEEVETEAAAS